MRAKVQRIAVECFNCGKEFEKRPKEIKERNFCSKACFKEKAKEIMNLEHIKEKCGAANRGRKLSADLIQRRKANRTKESYVRVHSDETKKIIGEKSSLKFTDEFKERFKETMTSRGHWIPDDKKDDWLVYKSISNWTQKMFDIVEFEAIKTPVRDHIFPRLSGYELGVFPEIIRHVVNCNIISRSENISKGFSDRKKSIEQKQKELFDLFERIREYHGNWFEHQIAIEKIEDYLRGERWQRFS